MMVTMIGNRQTIWFASPTLLTGRVNNLQSMSEEEFQKHIKKKLSQHLKKNI